jgi:S-DNA-T family DNA segregation ATPase FtsK/SpoIIIE
LVLAQVEDRPSFARMYRDERVALCAYSEVSITSVLDQLEMAATLCALAFGAVEPNSWDRSLVYNWPSASEHDLAWLGRHTVHEGVHHLMDVGRVLAWVANNR